MFIGPAFIIVLEGYKVNFASDNSTCWFWDALEFRIDQFRSVQIHSILSNPGFPLQQVVNICYFLEKADNYAELTPLEYLIKLGHVSEQQRFNELDESGEHV